MKKKLHLGATLLLPFLLVLSGCNISGGGNKGPKIPDKITIEEELNDFEKLLFLTEVKKVAKETLKEVKESDEVTMYEVDLDGKTTFKSEMSANLYTEAIEVAMTNENIFDESYAKFKVTEELSSYYIDYKGVTYYERVTSSKNFDNRKHTLTAIDEENDAFNAFYEEYLDGYFNLDDYNLYLATDGYYYAMKVKEEKGVTNLYNGVRNYYTKEKSVIKYNKDYELLGAKEIREKRERDSNNVIENYKDIPITRESDITLLFTYGPKDAYPKLNEKINSFPDYQISYLDLYFERHYVDFDAEGNPKIIVDNYPFFNPVDNLSRTIYEDGSILETYFTSTSRIRNGDAIKFVYSSEATRFKVEDNVPANVTSDPEGVLVIENINGLPEHYQILTDEEGDTYIANVSEESDYSTWLRLAFSVYYQADVKEDGTLGESLITEVSDITAYIIQ